MERLLREIVGHAYKKVPFYMNLLEKQNIKNIHDIEWDRIPLVKKDDVIHNVNSFISIDHLPIHIYNQLYRTCTSGSTGKILDIYWSKSDVSRSMLPLWVYRLKYYGVKPNDKKCYFYSSRTVGNVEMEYEQTDIDLGFSKTGLNKEKLMQIVNRIRHFQPKWMLLQPSIATLLCQVIKEYGIPRIKSIKYIELSGEMLLPQTRKEIEETFQCNIANQYGCFETNSIAYECKYGNLHCMEANVYTEVLRNGKQIPDGQEGDIYITSLQNYAMPFVRYEIGDKGVIHKNFKCACGNQEPVLTLTAGRNNDWVLCKDGTKATPYIFVRAIENINQLYGGIINQFQIIQKKQDVFIVKIALNERFNEDVIIECFCNNVIQPSLNDAEYYFEFFDMLFPEDSNGKLKYFKNDMVLHQQG